MSLSTTRRRPSRPGSRRPAPRRPSLRVETLEARDVPTTLVQSTFDADADGWRIGEFFSNAGDGSPTFLASGGNPGGFIRTTDTAGVTAFQAPAAFLGDRAAAYGGTLHLEQRLLSSDGRNYPAVLLSDGTLFLQFRAPPPGTGWTALDIPLVASAGWEVSDRSDTADADPPATEAQLRQVLGNLSLFNVRADWRSGADQVDLENVRLDGPDVADLEVTVADAPDPATVGEVVTYTITVTNHGPADATGVVIANSGPAGDQSFDLGGLATGASKSVQVQFTPAAAGTLTNTATATTAQADPDGDNNSATATTTVGNPEPVTIELADLQYEVREGEPFAILTVRRTGDLSGVSRVEYTTVDGTAIAPSGIHRTRLFDYTSAAGTLYFRPLSDSATIRVPIRDDARIEPDESFRVQLSNPSAGAVLGANTSAEVVIHDNDPSVTFSKAASSVGEGAQSPRMVEARLQSPSTQVVTVNYFAAGGTATPGQDYNPPAGTLIFQPGQTRAAFFVRPINDVNPEGNETATFRLANPTNAFLGAQPTHTVTIVDNDPPPPPQEPGQTWQTARFIDLQTRPRQSFADITATLDIDTFKVRLAAGAHLLLDVDPEGNPYHWDFAPGGLPNSVLRVYRVLPDGSADPVAFAGPSREPETGAVTNNAALRFQPAESGDYYIELGTSIGNGIRGYRLHFHRIGVSENVPAPELLNQPGPMLAWFDGGDTVGVTGPTGYGFTLRGPWQQATRTDRGLKQQTLTLPAGSQFTLASPQGVELPLVANGPITIKTNYNLWGDTVGEVTTRAVKFPASLGIAPINDLLADAFGSNVSVGVLTADWRISLGGRVVAGPKGDKTEDIAPFLAGVPYLRQKSPITISAQIGEYTFAYAIQEDDPIEVVFDPGDPMLYLRAEKIKNLRKPALGLSRHGLLEFVRQRDPAADLVAEFDHGPDAVPKFFGHVYVSGSVPFKIWYIPFEAHGDSVYNLDADRDGRFLAGLFDGGDLFRGNFDDLPNARTVLHDIRAGNNGSLLIKPEAEDAKIKYAVDAGEATWVFNGPAESFWFRGQRGTGGSLFDGTPLDFLDVRSTDVLEAMVHSDGHFLLRATATYGVGGAELEFGLTISNEGIVAQVKGKLEFSVEVDLRKYGLGRVGGRARANLEGSLGLHIDGDEVYLSGSIKARGRVLAAGEKWVDEEIDADVRSQGFRFDFPLVGNVDWNPFD